MNLGPVRIGEAAITVAGELPAHHVIHAASMGLGGRTTTDSLRSSMVHAFVLAREHGVRTIAIPSRRHWHRGVSDDECARVMAHFASRRTAQWMGA